MPRAVRRQLKALGEDPAAIVAAAAEPTSALHVYFE
jgi:ABC-type Fe2+-enterobactin transport system substrate-binding protein